MKPKVGEEPFVFSSKVYKPKNDISLVPIWDLDKGKLTKWQRALVELINNNDRARAGASSLRRYNEKYPSFIYRFLKPLLERMGIHRIIFKEGMDYGRDTFWKWIRVDLRTILDKDWAHDNQRNALPDKLVKERRNDS